MTLTHSLSKTKTWPEFLAGMSLFDNAVRMRGFIWTLQKFIAPGSRLLEVGFGSATTAVLLADLGYRVTGVDIDPVLVARAAERFADWRRSGGVEFVQADMLQLPWSGREFDLAYHQGVLEHFTDEKIVQALKEQARVASWVIFDVPNRRHLERTFGDERLLPPAHWRRLIGGAGLKLVHESGRDFHRWLYFLPMGLFSRFGLEKLPWFARRFAVNSIFVCRPSS